jgi:PAS domain S-box-containing protein
VVSVLFVDDDQSTLDLTRLFLERKGGMYVQTCPSTADALLLLNEHHFDAIISDFAMPGMDGISFLKEVRARGHDTPFIIFTGKHRAHVAIDALNNGADYYLQKGGEPDDSYLELISMVNKGIMERDRERELREREEMFRDIMEQQEELVCRFLPDGEITFANTAFLRFFGANAVGIPFSRLTTGLTHMEADRVMHHLASLSPSSPAGRITNKHTLKDGTTRVVEWSDRVFFTSEGTVLGYQSVGRDISERRDGARDQRESAAKGISKGKTGPVEGVFEELRQRIDGISDPAFATDTRGTVQAWNPALEVLTGVPAGSVIGKGGKVYSTHLFGTARAMLIDRSLGMNDQDEGDDPAIRVGNAFFDECHGVEVGGVTGTVTERVILLEAPGCGTVGAVEVIRFSPDPDDQPAG